MSQYSTRNFINSSKANAGIAIQRPIGGVSIFQKTNLNCQTILARTNVETSAIKTSYSRNINRLICNIFIPPDTSTTLDEILELLRRIPKPGLILVNTDAKNVS